MRRLPTAVILTTLAGCGSDFDLFGPDVGNEECYEPEEPCTALCLNELMADNDDVLVNAGDTGDARFPDWLELYNGSETMVSTEGLTLASRQSVTWTWGMPARNVPPRAHLLVLLDDVDTDDDVLHASFDLAREWGTVELRSGTERCPLDAVGYGIQTWEASGIQTGEASYGRDQDGGPEWVLMVPTPNERNVTGR